jgi:uncharacterized OsmC-like protein
MVKIRAFYEGKLRTKIVHEQGAIIETDAPKDHEGEGLLFSPTDLLAASLVSCTLTLMGIAARKLKVDLGKVEASVQKEMTKTAPRRISRITIELFCSESFDTSIQGKIEEMARLCPVHHSLHPEIEQKLTFYWGVK